MAADTLSAQEQAHRQHLLLQQEQHLSFEIEKLRRVSTEKCQQKDRFEHQEGDSMMHRLTLHEHDHGSSVYIIPKGTKVWHGSCSGWPPSRMLAAPDGRWFADLDHCVNYCSDSIDEGKRCGNRKRVQPMIYQFEFVRDVMLWALDQCNTVDHVYNLASQKFTEEHTQIFGELLEDAFYCDGDGDEEPQRMSEKGRDRMLVAYLCLLDEDIPGYACKPLAVFRDDWLHAEIFLCKPGNVLRATGQFVTPTKFEKCHGWLNPYRFRPY